MASSTIRQPPADQANPPFDSPISPQPPFPLVSVVIPCFTQGRFLAEAIASVYAQTLQSFELILVDDGAEEPAMREALAHIEASPPPRCAVLHAPHGGLAAARNHGISHSRGRFILPLDADDRLAPTLLEKCVWALATRPTLGVVYTGIRYFGWRELDCPLRPFDPAALLQENYLTATSMFPRCVWTEVGGYDETLVHGYEDWDFWLRLIERGYAGFQIPEYLFYYRQHERSFRTEAAQQHQSLQEAIRCRHARLYASPGLLPGRAGLYARLKALVPTPIKHGVKVAGRRLMRRIAPSDSPQREILLKSLRTLRGLFPRSSDADSLPDTTLPSLEVKPREPSASLQVLVLHPWLEIGGAEQVLLNLFGALRNEDVEFHLLTTLPSANPWYDRFASVVDHLFPLPTFLPSEHFRAFVLDYVGRRAIDVVLVSSCELGYQLLPDLAALPPPRPGLVDLLHLEAPEDPSDFFRMSAAYRGHLDHRVVITDSLKRAMVHRYGETSDRVSVIANGVDVRVTFARGNPLRGAFRRELGLPPTTILVTFIGRFTTQKQPQIVLEVARRLAWNPDLHFALVGDGELRPQLEAMVRRLSLAHVSLLSSRDDIPLVLEDSSLLLFPSRREGLPLVGIEAMCMERAIIASRVPGWVDLIDPPRTGWLVAPGDVDGFTNAVLSLARDPELRRTIGREARAEACRHYDLNANALSYLQLFRLLSRGCPSG